MSILKDVQIEAEQTAITGLVTVMGHADTFSRIKAEIERTNLAMPNATGKEKFAKVVADIEIFLKVEVEELEPVAEEIAKNVINMLIELALNYVKLSLVAAIA